MGLKKLPAHLLSVLVYEVMREEIVLWSYIDLSGFEVGFHIHPSSFPVHLVKIILAFSGQTASTKINAYYWNGFCNVYISPEIGTLICWT